MVLANAGSGNSGSNGAMLAGLVLIGIFCMAAISNSGRKKKRNFAAAVPPPQPTPVPAPAYNPDLPDWQYFDACQKQARRSLNVLKQLNADRSLVELINQLPGAESVTGDPLDLWGDQCLCIFYMMDMTKAYIEAGFNPDEPDKSMITLGLITIAVCNEKELPKYDEFNYGVFYEKILPLSCRLCDSFRNLSVFDTEADYNLPRVLSQCSNRSLYDRFYKQLIGMIKTAADGAEPGALPEKYADYRALVAKHPDYDTTRGKYLQPATPDSAANTEADANAAVPRAETIVNPMEQLEELIGLAGVKEEVKRLTNFINIQRQRQQAGLKCSPISYHCVFTGNPGTGKTTVARILAAVYAQMGILTKGHLVETDRSGLVAEYVGQTAVKTNKIIDSALDGVLFIDEAYSLVQGGGNDFGLEAIATLLKRMEDNRDRLVVILAGYSDEMQDFINANPGLESRFNRYIHFEDYSADDLMAIYRLQVKKHEYKLTPQAEEALKKTLEADVAAKDENFGNGRHVRNLFEKTLENQASRLANLEPKDIDRESLQLIEADDIPV